MAQTVETDDLRKQIEAEVTRDLGYSPDARGAGYVAMQWGVAAVGFLFVAGLVASIHTAFGNTPSFMYSATEELPFAMSTILVIAAVGYVYEARRSKVWYERFELCKKTALRTD